MHVAPPVIEWAMVHALDGGYFQRYMVLVVSQVVRSGGTSLNTYLPVLRRYPVLAIGMLQATNAGKSGPQFEWDERTEGWNGLR